MKIRYLLTGAFAFLLLLVACANEPQIVEVEVTRLVEQEVVVQVTQLVTEVVTEVVTEIVTEISTVEVPVETTRLVIVTATPEPATPTPTPTQTPTITPTPTTVQTTDATTSNLPQTGVNLLPNPSFEEDWYFAGFNELQIPNGWYVATDEGPNTLEPGDGGLFFRPEIRVVPFHDLPPHEHSQFIFDGLKTLKAFKGYAPTSFSLFTDIILEPGNYRLVIRYFPDAVASYEGGEKIYTTDPLAAEIRVIHNQGGTQWQTTTPGQRSVLTYDFTVSQRGTNRVGAAFRNRFGLANNGWFLDDWELYRR
jgi:hypothetical protein